MSDINKYISLLQSSDVETRKKSIIGLAKSESIQAIKYLIHHWKNDEDEFIRNISKKGLFKLKESIDDLFPEELNPKNKNNNLNTDKMKKYLLSDDIEKRSKAISGIIKFQNLDLFNELIKLLKTEENSLVLDQMITAVRKLGTKENAKDILHFLSYTEPKILLNSFKTIYKLDPILAISHFKELISKNPPAITEKINSLFLEYCENDSVSKFADLSDNKDLIENAIVLFEGHIFENIEKGLLEILNRHNNVSSDQVDRIDKILIKLSKIISDYKISSGQTDNDINYLRLMEGMKKEKENKKNEDGGIVIIDDDDNNFDSFDDDEFIDEEVKDYVLSRKEAEEKLKLVSLHIKAIKEAGNEKNESVLDKFFERLNSTDNEIIMSTILIALAKIGHPKCEEHFINFLSHKGDLRVRANAVEACGIIGPQRSLTAIQSLLHSSNHRISANSCIALAKICPENIVNPIKKLISSDVDHAKIAGYRVIFNLNLKQLYEIMHDIIIEEDDIKVCQYIYENALKMKKNPDSNMLKKTFFLIKQNILPKISK